MSDEHEFMSEMPGMVEPVFKTGEAVDEDGAYFCFNCVRSHEPLMVNLKRGDMLPVCATCGPESRWKKV